MITRALSCTVLLLANLGHLQAQDLQELMRQAMQQGGPGRGSMMEDTTAFTPLAFTGSYRMEIHTLKAGVPDASGPMNIRYHFSPDRMAFETVTDPSQGTMRAVFDLRNKHLTMLITDAQGQRTAMRTRLMKVDLDALAAGTGNGPGKVERTGETRVIEGLLCHRYVSSSGEGFSEAWLAEDVPFNMKETFGRMAAGRNAANWQRLPYEGGLVMELTQEKQGSQERTVIHTRDLLIGQVEPAVFSTDGFQVMDLTNLPLPGQ